LASITFCAIIATGYLRDLDFQGWVRVGQNEEIVDAAYRFPLSFGLGLPINHDYKPRAFHESRTFEV
jgi:hypothetical protein